MRKTIKHCAEVVSVDESQDMVRLRIIQNASCVGCQGRACCSTGGGKEKIITVHTSEAGSYRKGEQVIACMPSSMLWKTIGLAYFFPLLVLLAAFFLTTLWTGSELIQISIGFAAVGAYFFVLYHLRKRMTRKIRLSLDRE
jgi:sigma-E factor negative regulatory protein RseC